MFKKFLFLFALLGSTIVCAQKIDGIGEFKIGMRINEFKELQSIKEMNLREKAKTWESPKKNELLKTTSTTIFDEFLAGGIRDTGINAARIHSPDIEKYEFITSLGIKDFLGKDEYKTSITFFQDRLVFIGVRGANQEFERILTEKYGKPLMENKYKMETCQNGYGAKTEHMDGSINHYWGRGGAIEARYYLGNFSCGKYPYSGYEVYSVLENSRVNAIQAEGFKRLQSEEVKSKAGSSKL